MSPATASRGGRVSFSQNVMLDPRPIADLILRRDPDRRHPKLASHNAQKARRTSRPSFICATFIRLILDPS
jgi:hypothetical protein